MKNLLVFMATAALLFGCSHVQKGMMALKGNPFADDPDAISNGRIVYINQCAICHGNSGRGDGPKVASLSTRPPDLSQPEYDKSIGLIAANITYGKGREMPAFQDILSEKEIWDVSSYIAFLKLID